MWKIAEKAYGNGAKYTAIVEANKEVIKDADKIFPGQKFVYRKVYNSIKSAAIFDRTFFLSKLLINCAILAGFPVNFPVSIDCLIFFRYNLAVFLLLQTITCSVWFLPSATLIEVTNVIKY